MTSTIKSLPFGIMSDGSSATLFVLDNGTMRICISDYGAIITAILLPGGNGDYDDVLLGPSTLSGFANRHMYFGSTVGRFANRIADARFVLNGKTYMLAANNGRNHLHGGIKGFDRRLWSAEAYTDNGRPTVRMHLQSHDGEEGYPGTVAVTALFSLDDNNQLEIQYIAKPDQPTPISMTNHAYFNLRGEGRGTILDHELELMACQYLAVDDNLIPDGKPRLVDGTAFDFRTPKTVGRDIQSVGGYDHCFILDGDGLQLAARVREPSTGRTMQLYTTLPGVQFYSGNFLSEFRGKRGSIYDKHAGFCLEAQYFPDSPNRPDFPACIFSPERTFDHLICYRFGF
jgi:aldose 1-epimerase